MKRGIQLILSLILIPFSYGQFHHTDCIDFQSDFSQLKKDFPIKSIQYKKTTAKDSIYKTYMFENRCKDLYFEFDKTQNLILVKSNHWSDGSLAYIDSFEYNGTNIVKEVETEIAYQDGGRSRSETKYSYNEKNWLDAIDIFEEIQRYTRVEFKYRDSVLEKKVWKKFEPYYDHKQGEPYVIRYRFKQIDRRSKYRYTHYKGGIRTKNITIIPNYGSTAIVSKHHLKEGTYYPYYSLTKRNYTKRKNYQGLNEKCEFFYTHSYYEEKVDLRTGGYKINTTTKTDTLKNIILQESIRDYDYKIQDPKKFRKSMAVIAGMTFETPTKKKEYIKSIRYETKKTTKTFEYEFDLHNNWIKKSCFIDGVLDDVIEREITYYE